MSQSPLAVGEVGAKLREQLVWERALRAARAALTVEIEVEAAQVRAAEATKGAASGMQEQEQVPYNSHH